MKSKLIKLLIACLIVGATVGGGYYGYNKLFASKPTVAANQFITATAKKMNIEVNVQGTGTAFAAVSKDIAPNNDGALKELNLKVGDSVKKDQQLFISDSEQLKQNVTKAQANLDKANSALTNDKNSNTNAIDTGNAAIVDGQNKLNAAVEQVNKMTVKASAAGVVTAVNYSNNSRIDQGKTALTIEDSSTKKILQVMAPNNGVIKSLNVKVGDTVKIGEQLFVAESDALKQNVVMAQRNLDMQKSALENAQSDIKPAMDVLNINDAQNQLNYAIAQQNKMVVTSPISGMITAENNSNGDNIQTSNSILTIVDTSSMKIKVSVDELDIDKVKIGQKADIKFDAIKDKSYKGTVESISLSGSASGGVTTYDVVLTLDDSTNVKVGMNANVNILINSKENALTIPVEALINRNGNMYVIIQSADSGTANSKSNNSSQSSAQGGTQGWQSQLGNNGQSNRNNGQRNRTSQGNNTGGNTTVNIPGNGRLVPIKVGLQNENYVEVLQGITEGEKILIALPQTSSGNNANNKGGFVRAQGGNNGNSNNGNSNNSGNSKKGN